jgi:hypothetical protein
MLVGLDPFQPYLDGWARPSLLKKNRERIVGPLVSPTQFDQVALGLWARATHFLETKKIKKLLNFSKDHF